MPGPALHGPAAFTRGDTCKISGTLYNADGTLFDLAGASLAWKLVDKTGAAVLNLTNGSGITIVSAGLCLIVISAEQSAAIAAGNYSDQLRVTNSLGEIDTLWTGTIEVRPSLFVP